MRCYSMCKRKNSFIGNYVCFAPVKWWSWVFAKVLISPRWNRFLFVYRNWRKVWLLVRAIGFMRGLVKKWARRWMRRATRSSYIFSAWGNWVALSWIFLPTLIWFLLIQAKGKPWGHAAAWIMRSFSPVWGNAWLTRWINTPPMALCTARICVYVPLATAAHWHSVLTPWSSIIRIKDAIGNVTPWLKVAF